MRNFNRSKWCVLLIITSIFVACSSNDDSIVNDSEIPPVVVDPNNPNNPSNPTNPQFPTVDPTKLVVFETTNTSSGKLTSTTAVINDNNEVVITSKLNNTLSTSSFKEVGVCYSITNPNPTLSDTKVMGVINTEKTKIASKIIDSSLTNKKIYARTYYITTDGSTFYGDPVNLSTVKLVETVSVTNITKLTAVGRGKGLINATEPSKITEHGVCWSETNKLPTKADTWNVALNDYADYNVDMSKLKPNTVYYYRAFVKNATGTFYASEVFSF